MKPNIRAVFTDLDETLTTSGILLESTYAALWKLRAAGIFTVIITGRPAGWADALVRIWPVDAVVFENGCGIYVRRGEHIELIALAAQDNPPAKRQELHRIFAQVQKEIPAAHLALDQPFRYYDYAIDHSEQEPKLTPAEIQRVLEILRSHPGIQARPSSAHVNFLFGHHDKSTGAQALLDLPDARGIQREECAFIGDSLNDEPLFGYFLHTWGVANIRDVWDSLSSRPRAVTESRGGKGFEEFVSALLTP